MTPANLCQLTSISVCLSVCPLTPPPPTPSSLSLCPHHHPTERDTKLSISQSQLYFRMSFSPSVFICISLSPPPPLPLHFLPPSHAPSLSLSLSLSLLSYPASLSLFIPERSNLYVAQIQSLVLAMLWAGDLQHLPHIFCSLFKCRRQVSSQ